jgi:hypothetical protein
VRKREQGTGDRGQPEGIRKREQGTGNREQGTGNREQPEGIRKRVWENMVLPRKPSSMRV